MKLEYKSTQPPVPEPIAYVDLDGQIVFRDYDGDGGIVISNQEEVAFTCDWEPHTAKKVLYKGDTITITF